MRVCHASCNGTERKIKSINKYIITFSYTLNIDNINLQVVYRVQNTQNKDLCKSLDNKACTESPHLLTINQWPILGGEGMN